jgi:hypothetical protein
MIWCWGKEVTRDESWRGLRGSEAVIERRKDADDMAKEIWIREYLMTEERIETLVMGTSIRSVDQLTNLNCK